MACIEDRRGCTAEEHLLTSVSSFLLLDLLAETFGTSDMEGITRRRAGLEALRECWKIIKGVGLRKATPILHHSPRLLWLDRVDCLLGLELSVQDTVFPLNSA